jgi:hypothetical protein
MRARAAGELLLAFALAWHPLQLGWDGAHGAACPPGPVDAPLTQAQNSISCNIPCNSTTHQLDKQRAPSKKIVKLGRPGGGGSGGGRS